MRINRNIGYLLLAIWLILMGLAPFVPASAILGTVLAVLTLGWRIHFAGSLG